MNTRTGSFTRRRRTFKVVGYSAMRFCSTSAATVSTLSSTFAFGSFLLDLASFHSGASIKSRRANEMSSSGTS